MKALVIDDEILARQRILNLLNEVPQIEVQGEYSNGKTAINAINSLHPDLIFLDISMKDMNGFEVLQQVNISPKPIVIFVTAYDDYAIRAFDVDAFDFLLKPFRDDRFFKTIKKVLSTTQGEAEKNFENRIRELFTLFAGNLEKKGSPKLAVKQGNKTILLKPSEINYIVASGYYAEIFVEKQKYLLRESLTNLTNLFKEENFFRIHRSILINLDAVKEIVHSEFGEMDVRMTDGKLLHISKAHKKELFSKLGIK